MTSEEYESFMQELLTALTAPINDDTEESSRLGCIRVSRDQWETARRESEGILYVPKEFEDE